MYRAGLRAPNLDVRPERGHHGTLWGPGRELDRAWTETHHQIGWVVMRDVESALLETEQFTQSHALGQFVIEEDPHDPDASIVVAGIPEGDDESLLEQWLTAVFLALPGASVEDAELIEADCWSDDSVRAVRIRFSVD